MAGPNLVRSTRRLQEIEGNIQILSDVSDLAGEAVGAFLELGQQFAEGRVGKRWQFLQFRENLRVTPHLPLDVAELLG